MSTPQTAGTSQAGGAGRAASPARDGDWTTPALMRAGMFAGRWIAFRLEVAQEPVHGRRKTEKDRRPLAPSPIIRLWIKEFGPDGEGEGVPIDPADIEVSHLVCAADLCGPQDEATTLAIPVAGPSSERPGSSSNRETASPGRRSPSPRRQTAEPEAFLSPGRAASASPRMRAVSRGYDEETKTAGPSRQAQSSLTVGSSLRAEDAESTDDDGTGTVAATASRPGSRGSERSRTALSARGRSARAEVGGDKTARKAATGRNLYGNLHVAGVRVAAKEGGLGLWFLFTDLCIRNEGSYSLRFHCFDMTAITPNERISPLVHCRTADFKVYSPRNFPGLPKPTELADHFARQGYKLNTRKNERQAVSPAASPPPSVTTRHASATPATIPRSAMASNTGAISGVSTPVESRDSGGGMRSPHRRDLALR